MRRVSIFGVTPGMHLAKEIRGVKDELLLASGVELQPAHLRMLRDRGCYLIDVQDGLTDDIQIQDVITRQVRHQSVKAVQKLYGMVQKATSVLDMTKEESTRRGLKGRDFARASTDNRPVKELVAAAMAIVDSVLNQPETVLGLNSIKVYDDYTFQHSVGAAAAAVMLGRDLGWLRGELCGLATGCLMHDIGKVFVDREVLNKPGRLTPDEVTIIQQHAHLGYEMVLQIFGPGVLSNHVPYQHHERQDGTGYPRGLRGDNLPLDPRRHVPPGFILPIAQVASVADVYDALSSDRPYRPALPPDQTAVLMANMSGSSLNAPVLEHFMVIMSPFPVGAEVMMHGSADVEGCKGVVVKVEKRHNTRPMVRVLYSALGQQLDPFEVDLKDHPEIAVESTMIFSPGALNPMSPARNQAALQQAVSAAQQELRRPSIC